MAKSPLISRLLEGKDDKGRWVCAFYVEGTENLFGFLMLGRRAEAEAFLAFIGTDPCTLSEHDLQRAWREFRQERKAAKLLAANRETENGKSGKPGAAAPGGQEAAPKP